MTTFGWTDSDGNTCSTCTCGEEIYRAETPSSVTGLDSSRFMWFHSDEGTKACAKPQEDLEAIA